MNRSIGVLFLILLFAITPTLCSAQNQYGLSWGVSVGDEFQYRIDFTRISFSAENISLTTVLLVTVEELDDLSSYLNPEVYPPRAIVNVTYANGTGIGFFDQWSLIDHLFFIYPVGNWSLYQYVAENWEPSNPLPSVSYAHKFEEDSNSWSLSFEYFDTMDVISNTFHFSKSDGAITTANLHELTQSSRNGTTISIRTYQFTRLNPAITIPILISSAAIILEVIVVIEIVRRYRRRNVVGE